MDNDNWFNSIYLEYGCYENAILMYKDYLSFSPVCIY